MTANPRPKEPCGNDWVLIDEPAVDGIRMARWRSGPILATSSVIKARLPDGSGQTGPQWLVAISQNGKRPKPHHVRRALRAFGMTQAELDSHHPGVARHYFLVVDPTKRVDCECKAEETTVVEKDGYAWSNPTDAPCRGCEYEALLGKACPIHSSVAPERQR